jgi:hypothetical protein
MAKITRVSTTVTARYSPAAGAADAFWLDGRMPGTHEARAADITLDREDRSFFYSVFATQSSSKDSARDIEAIFPVLEKTHNEIKHSSKNIDNQIADLAECGVGVAGRVSVQHEGVRQPFFAGVMIKESEIAAVTMGRGCAYLYRNDVLYPLTKDDLDFEPIDHNGKHVSGIDIYCAGVAGTVRYSHIAQLQVDDCIILCNRELMEVVGQKEMLRILYDAYDQSDAAGMAITNAAAKLAGTPLQFMIGFVESITEGEKSVKGLAFPIMGRSQTPSRGSAPSSREEPIIHAESDEPNEFDQETEYEEEYDDEYEEYSPKAKRIALIAVVAIVLLACTYAIYTLVTRGNGGDPSDSYSASEISEPFESIPEESGSIEESQASSAEDVTPTVTLAPTPTVPPAGDVIATHTIKGGEWLSVIANQYYGSSAAKYTNAIINANKAKYPNFTNEYYVEGWVIDIPKVD